MSTHYLGVLRYLSIAMGVYLLAGCASPIGYQQAVLADDYGYREQRLGDNRFRVSFLGNQLNAPETLDSYLLYRAAELTQQLHYDYFVITARGLGPVVEQYTTRVYPSLYGGYGSGGFNMGVGVGFGRGGWGYPRYQRAMADILLLRGRFPAADRNAYDPRAILQYLGPVVRPATSPAATED